MDIQKIKTEHVDVIAAGVKALRETQTAEDALAVMIGTVQDALAAPAAPVAPPPAG